LRMDVIFNAFNVFIVPLLCFIILYCRLNVNIFPNWVVTKHECMGPKLTQAEGFILGDGAKMFPT